MEIPKPHLEAFEDLFRLKPEVLVRLSKEIASAEPAISPAALAKTIYQKLDLPLNLVERIVSVLTSLSFHKIHSQQTIETFVSEIKEGLESEEKFSSMEKTVFLKSWEGISAFFVQTLNCLAIEITSKAIDVLTSHEHPVGFSRIFSDVRAIFSSGKELEPVAAVIVHNLMIATANDKEYYFALDTSDLRKVREMIDRAISKEDALRKKIKECGMQLLTVEN